MIFFIKFISLFKKYFDSISSVIAVAGVIYTVISIIYEKYTEIENLKTSLVAVQEVVIATNEKLLLFELSSIEKEISALSEKRQLTSIENTRLINLLVKKELIQKEIINKSVK